jgi:hypothetical protein
MTLGSRACGVRTALACSDTLCLWVDQVKVLAYALLLMSRLCQSGVQHTFNPVVHCWSTVGAETAACKSPCQGGHGRQYSAIPPDGTDAVIVVDVVADFGSVGGIDTMRRRHIAVSRCRCQPICLGRLCWRRFQPFECAAAEHAAVDSQADMVLKIADACLVGRVQRSCHGDPCEH